MSAAPPGFAATAAMFLGVARGAHMHGGPRPAQVCINMGFMRGCIYAQLACMKHMHCSNIGCAGICIMTNTLST